MDKHFHLRCLMRDKIRETENTQGRIKTQNSKRDLQPHCKK